MFAKLLKYEWKTSFPLLLILSGCCLGVGGLSAVVLRLITANWDMIIENEDLALLLMPSMFFLFMALFAVILYAGAVYYIQLFRFYGSRFTDRGYLMFTLPVKTSHIFLSSAVNMLIWTVISSLVVSATILIATVFGPAWDKLGTSPLEYFFGDYFEFYTQELTIGRCIIDAVTLLISTVSGVVSGMTAIVIGAVLVKRLKILVSIGIMIGISTVSGIVNSIISAISSVIILSHEGSNLEVLSNYVVPIVTNIFPLFIIIGGYFLSVHLMQKKLNLP